MFNAQCSMFNVQCSMYKKFFTLHFFILSFFHSFFALLIVGCSGPYVPENAQRINAKPAIYTHIPQLP